MPIPPVTRIDRIAFRASIALPALLVFALRTPGALAQVGFNCGSQISITRLDSIDYLADAEWQEGAAGGYIGGAVLQWNGVGLHHDGPDWEGDLYREIRVGDHSYRFATEPGSYELTLRLLETVANGPENWLLNVSVDGQALITDLDLHGEVGKLRSLDLRRGVTAIDSLLDVSLSGTAGNVGLAGIQLSPLDPVPPLRPAVVDLSVEPTYGGALLRWRQPAPEHLDGYVVTVEDGWGTDLSSAHTYEARAVASADPTYIYRVETVDSMGRVGAEATGAGVAEKPGGDSVLRLMELIVADEDLRTMEQALRERVRVPADLRVDGLLSRGTVNFRGNATLEAPKKSYKFRIELGPDVDGSNVVSLAANFGDRSLIREIVGHELMVAVGHNAYRARPTRLTLNGEYAGVFTTIEEPDERYLERIGLDPVGRSYKVSGGLHPRNDLDAYVEDFENTNEDDWYRRDIAGLLQGLATVPDNEFEEWFRAMFEAEQVLDWYATQVYLANSDFALQNFLMTRDRTGGKWRILAWDADLLLKAPEAPANYSTSAFPDGKGRVHRLIDRALAVPAIMRQYLERLSALMDGPLAADSALVAFDSVGADVMADGLLDIEKRQREDAELYTTELYETRDIMAGREAVLRASIAELAPPAWVELSINELILPPDTTAAARLELHYRGRDSLDTAGLRATDDPGDLDKWPLPSRPLLPKGFLTLNIPRAVGLPSWIAITVPGDSGTVIVDSLTIPVGAVEPAYGRVPDGYGLRRLLPAATPNRANAWQDEVTVAVLVSEESPEQSEVFLADISVTSDWRDELKAEIQLFVFKQGGVWLDPDPVMIVPMPPLGAGEPWSERIRLRIPWTIDRGRHDLFFAIVESATGRRVGEASATIFVDDGEFMPLSINEICAINATILADGFGEYDDWAEIHNGSDTTIALADHFLTDDLDDEPQKWAFPPGATLAPGGHRIVWLDNDVGQGPYHASFKLNRNGEALSIVRAEGDSSVVVDRILFSYQEEDWSFGRYPDAKSSLAPFDLPSPGEANSDPVLE